MNRPRGEAQLNIYSHQADEEPSREHGQLYSVHCRVSFFGTARSHVQAEQTNFIDFFSRAVNLQFKGGFQFK